MGLFDFRCQISGLSLRAAKAAHVALIELTPGTWTPLSLPIVGSYDRGGSIDGFVPDVRARLLVAGFAGFVARGRVAAPDAEDALAAFTRGPDIARLLHLFERVNTMAAWGAMRFTLDGRPLRQVLIDAEVFAALTAGARPERAPSLEALEQQLADAPVAPQARTMFEEVILAGDEERSVASAALAQLAMVTRWLAAQGRGWSPVAVVGQFYADDDLKFAREARRKLAACAALESVLERRIAALEQENERQ